MAAMLAQKVKKSRKSVYIRNDVLKILYTGMLLEMKSADIRRFWNQYPLPGFTLPDQEAAMYAKLWEEDSKARLEYVVTVLGATEQFLLSCDIDILDFIRRSFQRINRGMLISARSVLSWGKPFLGHLFSARDVRPLLLQMIEFFTDKLAPGMVQRIVKHETVDDWNIGTMMLMHSSPAGSFKLDKKTFAGPLPPHDSEIWAGMIIQLLPHCMNIEPFEELFMICDSQKIEDVVWEGSVEFADNMLLIDDDYYGTCTTLHEFLRTRDISIEQYGVPDTEVIVAGKDYFCPRRERVVLHKGCAYQAPVGMYGFRYRRNLKKPPDFLAGIIDEATTDENELWSAARQKHEELLDEIAHKLRIVYHIKDESISVNGNHFIRSAPAKILRKIIGTYCETGQSQFEYREFIRDSSIIYDPVSPNLGVRLQRLIQSLEDSYPELKVTKPRRGKIAFDASVKIEYGEEDN
ncbi:MAG: hypothetical protein GF350_09670 [Chitinivibrionales bacterium]|nr:hypothetical protein [Chitinivibrionales bacterium]